MHGGDGPKKATREERLKNKDPKAPLAGHPNNIYRKAAIDDARAYLESRPGSKAVDEAMGILNGMSPESGPEPWVLLLSKARETNTVLAAKIVQVCELTHNDALDSAKTGADIIPVLHSICSGFIDADAALLKSWRRHLRGVLGRFEDGVRFDGMIKELIMSTARFGPGFDDGMFVILIEEMYSRYGRYDEICDICEEILGFDDGKAPHTLYAHIELSIATLAKHAAKDAPDNRRLMRRCAKILKRRAEGSGAKIPMPSGNDCTFQEIAKTAKSLAKFCKSKNSPFQMSKNATNHTIICGKFAREVFPMIVFSSPSVKSEAYGYIELNEAMDTLGEARARNLSQLHKMIAPVSKDLPFDNALQEYITEMAGSDSDANGLLTLHLLMHLCIERKMYSEVCDICEKISNLEGVRAQRMYSSILIECAIGELLASLFRPLSSSSKGVRKRCCKLLEARSERLNLGRTLDHYRGDKLTKAQHLASDIVARRRIRTPEEICLHIADNYKLSDEFLDLKQRIGDMVDSKAPLTTHISDILDIVDHSPTYRKNHKPYGALDELELLLEILLEIMGEKRIGSSANSKDWQNDMRAPELWDALLEMRVYVHCKIKAMGEGKDLDNSGDKEKFYVEPHPEINGGHYADVRVGKCHIEIYSPQGRAPSCMGRMIERSIARLCCKIMEKSQVEFFENLESMLAVRCDYDLFGSTYLRQLLEMMLQDAPRLGGIMLLRPLNDHYDTHFIRNKNAAVRVKEESVEFVSSALEKSILEDRTR